MAIDNDVGGLRDRMTLVEGEREEFETGVSALRGDVERVESAQSDLGERMARTEGTVAAPSTAPPPFPNSAKGCRHRQPSV